LEFIAYTVGIALLWFIALQVRSIVGRQVLYLAASYVFYASWARWFIIVLLFSSGMNYVLGQWLKKRTSAGRLWVGIGLNLVLLSTFKYLPLIGAGAAPSSPFSIFRHIALPLGISFWTFQALSYLFEIYREEELDPTLLEFCLYMAFWPTVLSGPICRMSSMLPQFRTPWSASRQDLEIGFRRICIGVLMSVLAGIMSAGLFAGQGIDAGFAIPAARLGAADVWCLLFGYAFQLYFNFCGYSHVVIGAARLFGLQLHENFNRPYLSTTPSMFWTRWHMSLSFWIRDFVFLPLATARRALWWRNLSLVIAMFIFGLWHKGSVLFMIWGTYHGVLLVLHRQWQELRKRAGFEWSGALPTAISWFLTFSAVCFGYIFFRAEDMGQASGMIKAIISPARYAHRTLPESCYWLVGALIAGYFAALGGTVILDWAGGAVTELRKFGRLRAAVTTVASERWVWIAPAVVVLAIYLSVVFQPGHADTGPVMYALF
jgi:alginate O-acetyltransferase complex protein AlgI